MATSTQYTSLITSEHADKPKFTSMVGLVAQGIANATNAADTLSILYDLDAAVGSQLDAIGLWVGISRQVSVPLAVYFSFDTASLGFDQGNIFAPGNPASGLVAMDDSTYRLLMRAKIGANNWDGTMASFNAIIAAIFFPLGITAQTVDNQDMTMTVYLIGNVPSAILAAVLAGGYLALRPFGVLINGFISITHPLFGFDQTNSVVAGFDTGYFSIS